MKKSGSSLARALLAAGCLAMLPRTCLPEEVDATPAVALKLRWRRPEHPSTVTSVAFSGDDRCAFSFSPFRPSGYTAVWDCLTGKLLRTITSEGGHVFGMEVSWDGHWLVQGGEQGDVYLSDLRDESGPVRVLKGSGGPMYALAATSDGSIIAAGDQHGWVQVWGREKADLIFSRKAHAEYTMRLRFLPGQHRLLSIGAETRADKSLQKGFEPSPFPSKAYFEALNRQKSTIKTWEFTEHRQVECGDSAEFTFQDARFTNDGSAVVIADRGKHVVVRDLETRKEIRGWSTTEHHLDSLVMDPKGELLVTVGAYALQFWEFSTGELLYTYRDPDVKAVSAAFSHDGRMLLVGEMLTGGVSLFEIDRNAEEP